MLELTNKTALVTGASRGIGRSTALALARAGARIIVHYGRSASDAQVLVAEITGAGGRADAVEADLRVGRGCPPARRPRAGAGGKTPRYHRG
jgi:3-oxoacyl-[acyl-carrier protein] reductase